MVILDAGLEEDGIRGVLDRVTQLVSARGGNPGRVDRWGKRRFAYELHHRWEGYYVLLEMTAETTTVAELDRMLTLADEVIRHKVIRMPEKVAGRARSLSPESAPEAAQTGNGA
jgi:small subunit ribosomal protein S6